MSLPRLGYVEAVCALAAWGLLLTVACNVKETTGAPEKPSTVVRGFSDGCVPEVVTSSSESADTTLVTFNGLGEYCLPNLVPWGIDMADPMGVDTPQGNNGFQLMAEYNVNTPPSPGGAPARAARLWSYSPSQVIIEFDPPVSSVEFYYSRLKGERAYWNGIFYPTIDSMPVWATSRTPGTLNYQFYATKTLYSNVSSTAPPWSVWTPVKLTAPGDKIQWLWFNGGLAIDNLKIVRSPLNCTNSLTRGQPYSCVVTGLTGWSVTGWDFTPDGSGGGVAAARVTGSQGDDGLALATATSSSSLPPWHESSTTRQWNGTGIVSGTVQVSVTDGASLRTYQDHINVLDRPSPWTSQWTYRPGPELTVADAEVGSDTTTKFGRNCPEQHAVAADCTSKAWLRVQPDPQFEPGAGYTTAQVPEGAYAGWWFIASVQYNMKRVGNVHPGMLVTSPRKHPVPSQVLSNACKKGLGVPQKATSADANMNQFNQFCGPSGSLGTDMTVFVPAIWGHEGLGYNGGVGHETLGRVAASEPQNDPYKEIDGFVAPDALTLANMVDATVLPIARDITVKARDHNPINGGPHGNYDPTLFPTREMYFWEVGSGGSLVWSRRPLLEKY